MISNYKQALNKTLDENKYRWNELGRGWGC
jgi:hypothetical protein